MMADAVDVPTDGENASNSHSHFCGCALNRTDDAGPVSQEPTHAHSVARTLRHSDPGNRPKSCCRDSK